MPNLEHLKLTEPVRLYLYSLLVVLVTGLVLAGVLTGEWREFLLEAGAAVLVVGTGTEAARASVYSPATLIQRVSTPPLTITLTADTSAAEDGFARAIEKAREAAGRHRDDNGDGIADGAQ